MRIRGKGKLFLVAGLSAGALVGAIPASAATTIGSDLADTDPTPDPSNGTGCSPTTAECTYANLALSGNAHPAAAPSHGVLVRWRVRASNPSPVAIALRVLRPAGAGAVHAAVSTSPPATFPLTAMTTLEFPTSQPVRAGDIPGLDVGADAGSFLAQTDSQPTTHLVRWQPQPADGTSSAPAFLFGPPDPEITFNADLEADLDCDGLGDESQDGAVGRDCEVTLTAQPKKKVRTKKKRAKVGYAFSAPALASSTQCSLDGAAFAACASPLSFKAKRGGHSFSVRGLDPDGAPGAVTTHSFKVLKKKGKKRKR